MARGGSAESSPSHPSSYLTRLHEKPVFHYAIFLLVIAALAVSVLALVNTYQLKAAVIPKTIDANDFMKKLTSHAEMKGYTGVAPLNVLQINQNNIANLQSQISGLDASYLGNFMVQYTDRIIIYDYDGDKIKGSVSLQQPQQDQLPADFLTRLAKHPEMQGLQNEQP
ncbi:MAG: hypothetical protein AAB221_01755, partial [Bacteroidota bacterium]